MYYNKFILLLNLLLFTIYNHFNKIFIFNRKLCKFILKYNNNNNRNKNNKNKIYKKNKKRKRKNFLLNLVKEIKYKKKKKS